MSKILEELTNKQANQFFKLDKDLKEAQIDLHKKHKDEIDSYQGNVPDHLKLRQTKEAQQLKKRYDYAREQLVANHKKEMDVAEKQVKLNKAIKEAQKEEEKLAKEARDKKVQEFMDRNKDKEKEKEKEQGREL